jgi:hypothetical protein
LNDTAVAAAERSGSRPLYATTAYARAFGFDVLDVEEWRTAVLIRQIDRSSWHDALGCYPLAAIDPSADLQGGLDRLRAASLVSVALVPDPLTGPPLQRLVTAFPVCRRFKTHFVIDREFGPVALSQTHRRWIRKALRTCTIARVQLKDTFADWMRLYEYLIARHQITDLQKFTPSYFTSLAQLPQVDTFAATREGSIIAMALWVHSGEVAYYHLGASDSEGYRAQAMYGIFATAIEHFQHYRFLHFGGGAGSAGEGTGGLANFKRGFANREVAVYFCGCCLDAERYSALAHNPPPTSFFPAYRQP